MPPKSLLRYTFMQIELITFNVRVPGIKQQNTLEVIGAGLWVLLEKHKTLGLGFTDWSAMDHAKLTMGDHALELHNGGSEGFEALYDQASKGLENVLASQWVALESFSNQLDYIQDIMIFCYPETIRLCVREK